MPTAIEKDNPCHGSVKSRYADRLHFAVRRRSIAALASRLLAVLHAGARLRTVRGFASLLVLPSPTFVCAWLVPTSAISLGLKIHLSLEGRAGLLWGKVGA
jgi:hypothetical protein